MTPDSPDLPPIPETLEEAVDQIIASMSPDTRAAWTKAKDEYSARLHHGYGTGLRNDWGLWHGRTALSKWFRARRLYHADDCSGTILKAVWRKLCGLPIDEVWVTGEAAHYEEFWRRSGLTWDQKPISGAQPKLNRTLRLHKDGRVEDV